MVRSIEVETRKIGAQLRRGDDASIVLQSLRLVDCVVAASKRNNNLTDNCSRNRWSVYHLSNRAGRKDGGRERIKETRAGRGCEILDKEMERGRDRLARH